MQKQNKKLVTFIVAAGTIAFAVGAYSMVREDQSYRFLNFKNLFFSAGEPRPYTD